MTKTENRGGAREGAGRPKKGRKQYGCYLAPALVARLDEAAQASNLSRADCMELLLDHALKQRGY